MPRKYGYFANLTNIVGLPRPTSLKWFRRMK